MRRRGLNDVKNVQDKDATKCQQLGTHPRNQIVIKSSGIHASTLRQAHTDISMF